jgi:hypothetical protein
MRKYNDLAKLTEEFGIKTYTHKSLPLVGFKYNMIDSPKYNEIVRWARGSVLEVGTWNIVAQPFKRFFNFGECEEERVKFDWNNFTVTEKVDGSLMILYNYQDRWFLNTSGSFGDGDVGTTKMTWNNLFWQTVEGQLWDDVTKEEWTGLLNKDYTYLFELCTIHNKVVRLYANPIVYFLGAFDIKNGYELTHGEVEEESTKIFIHMPQTYKYTKMSEILDFLHEKESSDPTYEGVVIRDRRGIRFKVKNEAYLRLHHMADNGNIANPKCYVPFLVKGEKDEVLTYFPELKPLMDKAEEKIQEEWKKLLDLWKECYKIESQKDFALSILKRTKFSGILFTLRKIKGLEQTEEDLLSLWQESHQQITDILFKE